MRRSVSCAAALLVFLLAGCDEEKQKPGVSQTEPAPEVQKTESKPVDQTASADAPTLPAVQAKAPANPEADPGRIQFDGDIPRQSASAPTTGVFAGNGAANPKPKTSYTEAASGNTLSVKEPPPPTGGGNTVKPKPIVLASARKTGDETGTGAVKAKTSGDDAKATTTGAGATTNCPSGMSYIDGYCIDKYEGSLTEGGKPWPYFNKLDPAKTYKAVSQAGVKPQAYISGDQAALACQASGKRLCSMKEWVKACSGPMKTQYPYGANYEAGACSEYDHKDHAGHRSAMHRVFGDKAVFSYIPMNDPRIDQLPETVAPAGAFSKCTNGYGVYDMVGNLHEWVSDKAGGKGRFKGGYFEDTHLNGDGCRYTTSAHETSYHDYSTGFRCCADPS